MIPLTEEEKNRLKALAHDEFAVLALKKLLLNSFLDQTKDDVQYLAASRLSLEFLEEGFKKWARMAVEAKVEMFRQNIV